ncbi:class I SAM-dependent methyltransferase [Holdemanella biformis]|uniref:class I SAM-dependent methyltransferase n=1 Tax=Holdemanella biformis TaxID=1735 RepID=UPI002590A3DF|nr:class I SAM-dependent methyltransferase [uncultured Holdemanella sp.]
MADKIQNAYESSKNIYDDVLTQGNIFSKLYIKLFWNGTNDNDIAQKVLSYIPNDFSGNLLDVPVGTTVFTEHKWIALKDVHIKCIQGDVSNLKMNDESYDIVVSMNGFHAFPDKKKAFQETWRVLKPGGTFIGCFYIRGKSKRTDWLVNHILSKKGWFTPPFQTEEELRNILKEMYKQIDLHIDGSMVYFCCTK